jgi:hypothetical protein
MKVYVGISRCQDSGFQMRNGCSGPHSGLSAVTTGDRLPSESGHRRFPVAARPVRVERGTVWPARVVVAADA